MSERPICDEIRADAMALEALPAGAPERARAEEHARGCAGCAAALEEGRKLLALVEAEPLPAPSPAARARGSAAILADLDAAPKLARILVALVLAAWALPLAFMRAPVVWGMDLGVSIMLAAVAAVSASFVITRAGRSGLVFIAASALLGVWPGGHNALEPHLGVHCALTEALTAAGVGVAAWAAARMLGRLATDRPILLAALGGGALAGHAALQIGCSAAHELPHVLVFHTGTVALAVGVALVLARASTRRAASA